MDELTKLIDIFSYGQTCPTLVFLGRTREHYNQERNHVPLAETQAEDGLAGPSLDRKIGKRDLVTI
jgi:hypothetical protein